MSFDLHKNFAVSTIAVVPSPANSGTQLTVATGTGSLFPTAPFNCIICPARTPATIVNAEIVRVTAVSGDVFTVIRHQEATNARTIMVGDQIFLGVTTRTLTDIETALANVSWTSLTGSRSSITLSGFNNDLGNYGGFLTSISGTNVTDALGYTPYDSANPSNFINSVNWSNVNAPITNPTGTLYITQNQEYNTGFGILIQADDGPGQAGAIDIFSGTDSNTGLSHSNYGSGLHFEGGHDDYQGGWAVLYGGDIAVNSSGGGCGIKSGAYIEVSRAIQMVSSSSSGNDGEQGDGMTFTTGGGDLVLTSGGSVITLKADAYDSSGNRIQSQHVVVSTPVKLADYNNTNTAIQGQIAYDYTNDCLMVYTNSSGWKAIAFQ